jgi:hypothetical protein
LLSGRISGHGQQADGEDDEGERDYSDDAASFNAHHGDRLALAPRAANAPDQPPRRAKRAADGCIRKFDD